MWHEIFVALVAKRGFSADKINSGGTEGNIVALRLLVDGLKIQPCGPNFIEARDAVLEADDIRYQGASKCTLWGAFAKRGLGFGANATDFINSHTLPADCQGHNLHVCPS